MHRNLASLSALFLPLLLGSCAYMYDLKAVMIDKRVAFIVDPNSPQSAHCIRSITVQLDKDGPKAKPEKDDNKRLVKNGIYWLDYRDLRSCENTFPIFYGENLRGQSDGSNSHVTPKQLLVNVVYRVGTTGSMSGSGMARFKLRADGQIENLPKFPSPSEKAASDQAVKQN